jgi:hypothetical protein
MLDAGDGYHLVVASAPLSLYGTAAIDANLGDMEWLAERATEHEAVVEHATKLGSVVPMKLFTLFRNDERACKHVLKMEPSLGRVVGRIAGCEEWGLRILFDPTHQAHAATAKAPGKPNETVSGTSFLRGKKAAVEEQRDAGARGAVVVDTLYDRLTHTARDAHRRTPADGETAAGQVLDAVFLVPHESVKRLKALVAESAKPLVDDGFYVTLSGPWPAYSFIGER